MQRRGAVSGPRRPGSPERSVSAPPALRRRYRGCTGWTC
jgi:hypothetical protein